VTAEGVVVDAHWQQRLNGAPDGIEHFGIERAHDGGRPPLGRLVWAAPRLSRGHTSDRWMVYLCAYYLVTGSLANPRGLLRRAPRAFRPQAPSAAGAAGCRVDQQARRRARHDPLILTRICLSKVDTRRDAAGALRAELERIQALHGRSMKLPAAAVQLHLAASTVRILAERGDLDVDPETDSSGLRFVTRASVKQYWIAHHEAKRRPAQPVVAVPVAEVARFTGETSRALMDLVRAGVLEQIPGRRSAQLTATSLRTWMAGRDPDDAVRPASLDLASVTPLRPAPESNIVIPPKPVTLTRGASRNGR
jgi:hypothetical protein